MKWNKSKIFLFANLAFIIGIILASFLSENICFWAIYFFLAPVLFIRSRKNFAIWSLFFFCLLFGVLRYDFDFSSILSKGNDVSRYVENDIVLTGVVYKESEVNGSVQKIYLKADSVGIGNAYYFARGKVLVSAPPYPYFRYGDVIMVECELKEPEAFNGFAYDRYLNRYGIRAVCYTEKIRLVESGRGNMIMSRILSFKDNMRSLIIMGLEEPEASMARAILLGDSKELPLHLRNTFSQVGISHIISISGTHISIISLLLLQFFIVAGLSRKKSFLFVLFSLALYIIMIGAPASAIRAGLMSGLAAWAYRLGRMNSGLNALAFAASWLLLFNPKLLRDDIGFQLSFLAVFGLIYFYPKIDSMCAGLHGKVKAVWQLFAMTIAAQIPTLPIIVYHFKIISLVSPIANIVIVWTIPFVIVSLIFGMSVSYFFPEWASYAFLPALVFLRFIIRSAEWLSRLPFSFIILN